MSTLGRVQQALADAQPTRLDRAIATVFPGWGRSRMEARQAMAASNAWTGARYDLASLKTFFAATQSADDEQRWDRETLLARATDLERNDPLAGGAISEMVLSVVGTGLSVRPTPNRTVLGWSQDQAVEWAERTKQAYALWADSASECDLARERNFYQLQTMAYRTCQSRGDAFALLPRRAHPGGGWKLKVQLIEGDRCCNPKGRPDTPECSQGIELDPATGAQRRVWICTTHPSMARAAAQWNPRDVWGPDGRRQVLHLKHTDRIDVRRGYPLLAPVIATLKQLSRLSESELAAAVVTSFFAVAIKKNGSSAGPLAGLKSQGSGGTFTELGPAIVAELQPGEDVQNIAPTRPNGAFDPYWRSMVGQLSMRIGIPPEVLLKKFESSYTAARGALVQFGRFVTVERDQLLAPNFCQPIYEAWLAEAVLTGRVDAPGFFADPILRSAYSYATWVGDNLPILDPLKEVLAATELVESGFSDYEEQTLRLTGGDWEQTHERLVRQVAKRRRDGLIVDLGPEAFGEPTLASDHEEGGEEARPARDRRAALIALALKEDS